MVLWPQSSYACWYLLFWTNCDESIETEHEIRLEFDATETVAAISEEIRKRSLDVPKNLVDAFIEGTDTIIQEQIFPLLTKLEKLGDITIDKVSAEANQLIDKTFGEIIPILDEALALAKDISRNWTPEQLERHIIASSGHLEK